MKLKDVSFWCVVLAIIIAMTVHHILSENLIEGNTNSDIDFQLLVERTPEIDLKNEEIANLEGEIGDLRGEISTLQDNLKNSQSITDQIQLDAATPPIQTDNTIDEDASDIIEPDEIIFPIDDREHIYEITTCGKMGKDPPTKADCGGKHVEDWFNDPSLYNYDENKGIHHWFVPKTGSYIIEAAGSSGGTIKGTEEEDDIDEHPGRGATMRGIFYLKEGEKYNIVIGQKGTTPKHQRANPWNGGAGAGGGTFMWKDNDISEKPLIVAGGGGGQGVFGQKISGHGGDGSLIEDGTMGPLVKKHFDIPDPSNLVNNYGTNGRGGGDFSKPLKKSKGWIHILNGGDIRGINNMYGSESGFGGGGIMATHAGGGGGGYSGGGSKRYGYSESNTMGGGGGGSYFSLDGFKREDSSDEILDYNEEDGYLKIKFIKDYFFVEGNKVKCKEYGGYEPVNKEQCKEGSEVLGFEWKTGPRRNGWNNNNCEKEYSKCVWREESDNILNKGCPSSRKVAKADQGLMFNEKCSGMDGYGTNGVDNIYKTVCVAPIKALGGQDEAQDEAQDSANDP